MFKDFRLENEEGVTRNNIEKILVDSELTSISTYYKSKVREIKSKNLNDVSTSDLESMVSWYNTIVNTIDKLIYTQASVKGKKAELLADIRAFCAIQRTEASRVIRKRRINSDYNSKVLNFGAFTDCHDSFKKTSSGHFKGIKGISL